MAAVHMQAIVRGVRLLALLVVTLLGVSPPLGAQFLLEERERMAFDRPESWAMKYFASLNALTGLGAPRELGAGSVHLELEGGWVPSLSEAERTVGFNGLKTENLNRTSVFVRPRVVVGLPRSLSLTLAWVPPVDLDGVEANLLSVALGGPVYRADKWRLGLTGFGQLGSLEGDLTCDRSSVAAGDDPVLNPFGCEQPSSDEQEMSSLGLELSWAWRRPGSRWEPHVGILATYMDLELQIRASYADIVDRTLLTTDGTTYAVVGGLSYLAGERWRIAGELFYSPLDVVRPPKTTSQNDGLFNVRALLSYRIRSSRADGKSLSSS